jgi:hypothetical protein
MRDTGNSFPRYSTKEERQRRFAAKQAWLKKLSRRRF